jgi:hypothetical protein
LCWIQYGTVSGLLVAALASSNANAQAPDGAQSPAPSQQAELARKLANPISDLVSVPFQFNWEQNVGPAHETDSSGTSNQ